MRLFVAFDVPESFNEYFHLIQKDLKDFGKLTLVQEFHVTLKFLGDVEEGKIERIKKVLGTIRFTAIKTKLTRIGLFPNENYVRVVWIGLSNEQEIIDLQKQIDFCLAKFFGNERDFQPHVTLARVKFVHDKKGLAEAINKIKIEPMEFEIKSFKLKKSTLTPQGPIYEDIEEYNANS